jgi:hypothetical protein
MSYSQAITPTPWIPATGGWCLQYVRQAYGLPAKYNSATEAWEKSTSQHRDRNFPPGLWVPVWYGIDVEPLGHVVLRAPDGRVYSTSDYSGHPVIHNSLEDLEAFYAYYGMVLQYRGWTEDVAGYKVINNTGLAAQGDITKEDELSAEEVSEIKAAIAEVKNIANNNWAGIWKGGTAPDGKVFNYGILPIVAHTQAQAAQRDAQIQATLAALSNVIKQLGAASGTPVDLEAVTAAAEAGAAKALSGLSVTIQQGEVK